MRTRFSLFPKLVLLDGSVVASFIPLMEEKSNYTVTPENARFPLHQLVSYAGVQELTDTSWKSLQESLTDFRRDTFPLADALYQFTSRR